jgi:hypothetical protein
MLTLIPDVDDDFSELPGGLQPLERGAGVGQRVDSIDGRMEATLP